MGTLEYLSYSRISLFLQCPAKYELRYVEKAAYDLPVWLFFGGTVHYALRRNFEPKIQTRKDLSLEHLLDIYSSAFESRLTLRESVGTDRAPVEKIDWEGQQPGFMKDLGIGMLSVYHQEYAPSIQPVAVELDFNRQCRGVQLVGRIDLVKDSGDVIDFKTAKRKKNPKDVARDLQPGIYAAGCGGPIDNFEFHYLLKTVVPEVQVLATSRSQQDIDWIVNRVLPPIARSIEAGLFPANPTGWLCSPEYCEYFRICRGRMQTRFPT